MVALSRLEVFCTQPLKMLHKEKMLVYLRNKKFYHVLLWSCSLCALQILQNHSMSGFSWVFKINGVTFYGLGWFGWLAWLITLSSSQIVDFLWGQVFKMAHTQKDVLSLSLCDQKEWAQICSVSVHVLSLLARLKLGALLSHSGVLKFLSSQIFRMSEKYYDVLFCFLCLEKRSSNCLGRRWCCISLLLDRNDENTFLLQNLQFSLDIHFSNILRDLPCSVFPLAS